MSVQSQSLASLLLNSLNSTQTNTTTSPLARNKYGVDPETTAEIRKAAFEAAFTKADANKTNALSYSEFKNFYAAMRPTSVNLDEQSLPSLFLSLDENKDGRLQSDEAVTRKRIRVDSSGLVSTTGTGANNTIQSLLLKILTLLLGLSGQQGVTQPLGTSFTGRI